MHRENTINPALSRVILHLSMPKGGVKRLFLIFYPTDGPLLMSDIPKCSEIYAGSDAVGAVAIT